MRVDGATGSDTGSCGTVAQPCKTIQGAINIAADGDVILVAAGTYQDAESCLDGVPAVVCLINRHLTILGGYTNTNWSAANPTANPTIIDGQNVRRVMQFWGIDSSSASLTIQGFTIRNGYFQGASSGGNGQTFAFGGGILADRGLLVARDMVFENNTAVGGNTSSAYGGAGSGGGLALRANPAGTTLENILFENNEARGGTGPTRGGLAVGGGLYTFDAQLSGSNLTLINNQAIAGNGNGSGSVDGLKADAQGGGAAFQVDSVINLQNITATGNQAIGGDAPNGDAGGAFGGGIFTEIATVTLENIDIRGNSATGGDGQNPNKDGSLGEGGGLSLSHSNTTINRATIVNNSARGGDGTIYEGASGGGGVYSERFFGSTTTTFINTIIGSNTANTGSGSGVGGGGGGYFVNGDAVTLLHTTLANNQIDATGMQGSGMVVINGGSASLSESIVANHAIDNAVYAQGNNSVSLTNNLFNNNNQNTGGSGTFTGISSIFSGNPNFVSPGSPNYNFHIGAGSAAINQANGTGTAVDIDNHSRTAYGLPDVGADEYAPISLTVSPGDGTLLLFWNADLTLLAGLDHYDIVVTQGGGASPPNEGPSPINAGANTSFTLTGLTNNANYTITIQARNSSNGLIASSNTVVAFPTDDLIFIPSILR
ncbi:MAG: fibronectin type III domain-containing protein [Ardenticatenaceae bacterium]|nr:fibronectin type III domain-containing protein [Ardenticatenaceae bacterium]